MDQAGDGPARPELNKLAAQLTLKPERPLYDEHLLEKLLGRICPAWNRRLALQEAMAVAHLWSQVKLTAPRLIWCGLAMVGSSLPVIRTGWSRRCGKCCQIRCNCGRWGLILTKSSAMRSTFATMAQVFPNAIEFVSGQNSTWDC